MPRTANSAANPGPGQAHAIRARHSPGPRGRPQPTPARGGWHQGNAFAGVFRLRSKRSAEGQGGTRPQPRRKAPATRPPQTARPQLPPRPPSNAASTSTSTSTRASLALFWCLFAPNHQQRQRGRKGREKQKREEKSTYILYSDNFSLMPPLCPQLAPNLPPKISIAKNLLSAISF